MMSPASHKTLSAAGALPTAGLSRRKLLELLLTGTTLAFVPSVARAEGKYPSKPIKIVVSGPPGAIFDIVSRVLADGLSKLYGTGCFVENKPGASGIIGMRYALGQEPDGYTLLAGGLGLNILPAATFTNLPIDPARGFVPLAYLGDMYNVFIVRPDSPIKSIESLVRMAKEKPGTISIGTNPPGSSPHMGFALFARQAGIEMNYVPYRGPNEVLSGVLSGTLDVGMSQLPAYVELIKGGKIRALGVSASKRASFLPNVPTVREAGVPEHEMSSWLGMYALPGTPQPIVDKLGQDILKVMADPAIRAKLEGMGFEPNAMDAQGFSKRIEEDIARWSEVAKSIGVVRDFSKQTF
jgi:tripartite-type tricarboxylate transporter receptor subunit TctC